MPHILTTSPPPYPKKHYIRGKKGIYQGRNVTLESPRRLRAGDVSYGRKKFEVFVLDGARVKRVTYGDPNMKIRKNNPAARANFLARHNCDTKKSKLKAGYWSCQKWL